MTPAGLDHQNLFAIETLVLGEAAVPRTGQTLRVLAFTCSMERPFFLRCCALQMRQQTYPVDHCIYINHPEAGASSDHYNYISLLMDLVPQQGRLLLRYGRSGTQQFNHMQALRLADLNQYDLFLKIDDDDVYRQDYVQRVVDDYLAHAWDFSGGASQGILDGPKWGRRNRCTHLGMEPEDLRIGVAKMMPSSYAFSRKALALIQEVPGDQTVNEDILWRRLLTANAEIKTCFREKSRMAYHLHGKNFSTCDSFGKIV
jgi:hypothetical protein